uniref:Amino acid transporter transmembrane domain-containing protein n=1 Tax=Leersia perrieri TaxID=77586 RepID=A0A0D9WWW4_9ORYZ
MSLSTHLHLHLLTPTSPPSPATYSSPRRRLHFHLPSPRSHPTPTLESSQNPAPPQPLQSSWPSPRRQWRWRSKSPPPPFIDDGVSSGGEKEKKKSFWGAVSLIVGTAVGPGMLGLPSATIRSGMVPSTAAIVLSWVYVLSSIVLVAELTFAAMEDGGVGEVSFTGIASNTLGASLGTAVAVVYAALSFALLVACVAGIGSLASQLFPAADPVLANAVFPCFAGALIAFFPFEAVDGANRALCGLMLVSIAALVVTGVSVGRSSMVRSLGFACWRPAAILPAIPVTVLTLGFHVITPFICKIVGDSVYDARRAILIGGAVPLAMVLSWNAVILGLAGSSGSAGFDDPIKLLLSVNPAALPAVRGFAFAALATSLIGYAVSFPKQLADTMELIVQRFSQKGGIGQISESSSGHGRNGAVLTWIVLIIPIVIASFFSAAFSKALDFAGVYANCFLFGILPPVMAWIHRLQKRKRSYDSCEDILPGGNAVLLHVGVVNHLRAACERRR